MKKDHNTYTGSNHDDQVMVTNDSLQYDTMIVYGKGGKDDINGIELNGASLIAYGGAGNDKLYHSSQSDYLSGDGGNDRIFASDNDTVTGGSGDDRIFLYGVNEQVSAGDGNDTVFIAQSRSSNNEGNAASLELDGGDGEDTLVINGNISGLKPVGFETVLVGEHMYVDAATLAALPVIGWARQGHSSIFMIGQSTVDGSQFDASVKGWLYGSGFDDVLDFSSSESALALNGRKGNDILTGNDRDNLLVGDMGSDTIQGGGGNDKIYTGAEYGMTDKHQHDVVDAGSGNDRIYVGGNDVDAISGGSGNDVIVGGRFGGEKCSGYFYGDGGNDVFRLGNDVESATIIGGDGQDVLVFNGKLSNRDVTDVEVLRTGEIEATATVLNSFSTIAGVGDVNIHLIGKQQLAVQNITHHVFLDGSGENNNVDLARTVTERGWTIDLGDGNDRLVGTDLDDTITGGKGNDVLDGAGGQDTFVMGDHDGKDSIRNFQPGLPGDILDFSHSSRIQSIGDFLHHLTDDGHLVYGGSDIDLGATKAFIEEHWVVGNLAFHE